MTMTGDIKNLEKVRDRILEATLLHIPIDGWNMDALYAGCIDAGFEPEFALVAFNKKMIGLALHWSDYADRRMVEKLKDGPPKELSIRRRIVTCIKTRLDILAPHRQAARSLFAFLSLPGNGGHMVIPDCYNTADKMWRWAGDNSKDFNFYTKRLSLSLVYQSTFLCWLGDESEDFKETWAFLDRRIEDVMQVEMVKGKVKSFCAAFSPRSSPQKDSPPL